MSPISVGLDANLIFLQRVSRQGKAQLPVGCTTYVTLVCLQVGPVIDWPTLHIVPCGGALHAHKQPLLSHRFSACENMSVPFRQCADLYLNPLAIRMLIDCFRLPLPRSSRRNSHLPTWPPRCLLPLKQLGQGKELPDQGCRSCKRIVHGQRLALVH